MLSVVIRCLFGGVPKNVQQKTVQKLTCASASASPKMLAKNSEHAKVPSAVHDTKTGPAVIGRNRKRNNVPVHPTVTTGKQSKNRIFATIRASRARLGPADDVAGSNAPPR